MHMYNQETKEWNAPPPTYECIGLQHPMKESNLAKYITISEGEINHQTTSNEKDPFGAIYSLPQLKSRFGVK
jgi:hypothetical protein